MDEHYLSYLLLLDQLCTHLKQLTELSQQKTTAVKKDDLVTLDLLLKQEQALALSLRGLEQKREKELAQLRLENVPLLELAGHCPSSLYMQAKQTTQALHLQYQIYHSAAEVARNTLECNLHEIEKVLASLDDGTVFAPGYAPVDVELPTPLKTDFLA